jgi:hypothetical protein
MRLTKTACAAATISAALVALFAAAPPASAAGAEDPGSKPAEAIEIVTISGVKVDKEASAETRRIIRADLGAAAAAANVCGTGYNISTGAWREGTYGTTYTWTNGRTTGSSYYDKPICGVFFNDTGATRYMGVRLRSNYTSDASKEDFGRYSTYAGPVYQNRGYCGTVYSYMKDSNGRVVVDRVHTVGSCN